MATIPVKIKERFTKNVKNYQAIIQKYLKEGVNESDTVTLVTSILSDIFGYDKFSEITSELKIRNQYCDLAIKINNSFKYLIEVKSIGISLNINHLNQLCNYGVNKGNEWVILTNGKDWKVYKIKFGKPLSHDLVFEFSFTDINLKRNQDIEMLYLLCRESIEKNSIVDFHSKNQTVNKFVIGNILVTTPVLDTVRKVIKKLNPDAKCDNDTIQTIIMTEILKSEVYEDEKGVKAKKMIAKYFKSLEKPKENE